MKLSKMLKEGDNYSYPCNGDKCRRKDKYLNKGHRYWMCVDCDGFWHCLNCWDRIPNAIDIEHEDD